MLHVLSDLRKASGFKDVDPELEQMKQRVDIAQIQRAAESQNI